MESNLTAGENFSRKWAEAIKREEKPTSNPPPIECKSKEHLEPMKSLKDIEFPANETSAGNRAGADWPEPLGKAAFYGIIGRFCETIAPHTESDIAALLIQMLVFAGNYIGRGSYVVSEADKHFPNLFVAIVGDSAKARKGTSLGQTFYQFEQMDITREWVKGRVKSGLSSGEGLIAEVADNEDGVPTDQRLLVTESEFALVLSQFKREGNILSPTMRAAWDAKPLGSLVKQNKIKSSNATISFIGHITEDELKRCLTEVDISNGVANRLLWCCAKRSKLLALGGDIETVDFSTLRLEMTAALEFGTRCGKLDFAPEARPFWVEVYEKLSVSITGKFGAVTGRSDAQVKRLAMIYSILDQSKEIRVCHIKAALALWQYCEDSCRRLFGASLGNITAERILVALKANPQGLSRTDIRDLFKNNKSQKVIEEALKILEERGLAYFQLLDGKTRRTEVWSLKEIGVTT